MSTRTPILSKSLALIEKTRARLEELDQTEFPTRSTVRAHELLLRALEALREPRNLRQVDAEVLFNKLVELQAHLDDLENSSSDRISWPLVKYCDQIWDSIMNSRNELFYTLTRHHNFTISSFSSTLRQSLTPILPLSQVNELLGDRRLYCLRLASLENNNLPMYANITHEFGHALWDSSQADLQRIWSNNFVALVVSLSEQLRDEGQYSDLRLVRLADVLMGLAVECFADLLAALLVGPAFFLSLSEITWGHEVETWHVRLAPQSADITAYPSAAFRLRMIDRFARVKDFREQLVVALSTMKTDLLRNAVPPLEAVLIPPSEPDEQRFAVFPTHDPDAKLLQRLLATSAVKIEEVLEGFLVDAREFVLAKGNHNLREVDVRKIRDLLERLEEDILPNIIPDGTLLGKPADFPEILNASAVYRFALISSHDDIPPDNISVDLDKLGRMTEKALEVSYIQRKYRAVSAGAE